MMEELTSFRALRAAALRAARGLRDRRPVAGFLADLERNVLELQRTLRAGTWAPGAPHVFHIRDPKPRVITAAPFPDRVVHHALMAVLEPRFEARADPDSFACRPGGGPWAAVARVRLLARDLPWAGRLDVRHFFETVQHDVVMQVVAPLIPEAEVFALWERIIRAGGAGRGLPIGSLISQHAANLVLGELDADRRRAGVRGLVRYMDDVVLWGLSPEEVWEHIAGADDLLQNRLRLRLKDAVTVVAPVRVGIPFLGLRVWSFGVRPDHAHARRLRRTLRTTRRRLRRGQISVDLARRRAEAALAWATRAGAMPLVRSLSRGGHRLEDG